MSKQRTNKAAFTPREVAEALNNAFIATMRPEVGAIPEPRFRKLREYAQALVEAPLEHVGEGLLRYEELEAVLVSAALYVHLQFVADGERVPMAGLSNDLHKPRE